MLAGLRRPERGPYVIAEIGVNHDGDREKAEALVAAASDAGADAVKFQHFRADLLMSNSSGLAEYQRAAGESDPIEMLRRLELSDTSLASLAEHAIEIGLDAIVTVFTPELVEMAERAAWTAFKVASPDLVNKPLLRRLVATGRSLLLSTGGAHEDEVRRTLEWLAESRVHPAVFQCVSAYPTPVEDAALEGIAALQALGAREVGYSDHTQSIEMGALAVGAGATLLEKHLTYDRNAPGPDHAASLGPEQFVAYVRLARAAVPDSARIEEALKIAAKSALEIEQDVRTVSRQSLAPTRSIRAGERLRVEDLTTRRPGTGVSAWSVDDVVGRAVRRALAAGEILREEDIQ